MQPQEEEVRETVVEEELEKTRHKGRKISKLTDVPNAYKASVISVQDKSMIGPPKV